MAQRVEGVRVLGVYGDNLNTDHVSPGGEIPPDSPAGQYLQSVGVKPAAFNSYVGRRGNHHVMVFRLVFRLSERKQTLLEVIFR